MRIFVSGSLAYDRIMNFPGSLADHMVTDAGRMFNVSFEVGDLTERYGGTAGNIAYSLSLMEESPLVLATLGKDYRHYEEWLRHLGLTLEGVRQVEESMTARAYIVTDESDNRITGFVRGAANHACLFHFDTIGPGDAVAIVAPGNIQDMIDHPRSFKELNIPVVVDPGQTAQALGKETLWEMIDGAALLITSAYDLEVIRSTMGAKTGELARLCGAVIVTQGAEGATIHQGGDKAHVPAVEPRDCQDPTGAGDAFRAGVIKGLASGKSLEGAVRLGATCASFCVEVQGTQEHSFSMTEFMDRHGRAFGTQE